MSVIGPVQSRFDKIPACGRQMDMHWLHINNDNKMLVHVTGYGVVEAPKKVTLCQVAMKTELALNNVKLGY